MAAAREADERDVEEVLASVGVKLGGGKVTVPLKDMLSAYAVRDLVEALGEWADDL